MSGRNELCKCGSGKKYKKCCLSLAVLSDPWKSLLDGKARPFVKVSSTNGAIGQLEISHIDTVVNLNPTIYVDELITLNTNTIDGDVTGFSSVLLSFPEGNVSGEIDISGNANIALSQTPLELRVQNEKIKAKSINGLSAVIYIGKPNTTGLKQLEILFGVAGQKEEINDEGRKNRSHISIMSTGNSKFIRLSDKFGDFDSSWEITNKMVYECKGHRTYPRSVLIRSTSYKETLTLNFELSNDYKYITLVSALFSENQVIQV